MVQYKVAVIGAGIAGLTCARQLVDAGCDVTVFEKSRGAGGRAPTRWISRDTVPPVGFDHGAQYFFADDPRFRSFTLDAQKSGLVAPWMGRIVDLSYGEVSDHPSDSARWVGVPGMNAIGAHLANGVNLLRQHRVVDVNRSDIGWSLAVETPGDDGQQGFGPYDAVICAIPAEQACELFHGVHKAVYDLSSQVVSNVTWALMLDLPDELVVNYDGAFVHDSPLGWIARDSSKPGRASGERWLIQATADWSRAHVNEPHEVVSEALLDVFRNVTGLQVEPNQVQVHRWLYSLPANPLGKGFFLDSDSQIGLCGDWLSEGSMQAAFISGLELGESLVNAIAQQA